MYHPVDMDRSLVCVRCC